jgi:hypothetical protein
MHASDGGSSREKRKDYVMTLLPTRRGKLLVLQAERNVLLVNILDSFNRLPGHANNCSTALSSIENLVRVWDRPARLHHLHAATDPLDERFEHNAMDIQVPRVFMCFTQEAAFLIAPVLDNDTRRFV